MNLTRTAPARPDTVDPFPKAARYQASGLWPFRSPPALEGSRRVGDLKRNPPRPGSRTLASELSLRFQPVPRLVARATRAQANSTARLRLPALRRAGISCWSSPTALTPSVCSPTVASQDGRQAPLPGPPAKVGCAHPATARLARRIDEKRPNVAAELETVLVRAGATPDYDGDGVSGAGAGGVWFFVRV